MSGPLLAKSDALLLSTLWKAIKSGEEVDSDDVTGLLLQGQYAKALEQGLKCLGTLTEQQESWFCGDTVGGMKSLFEEYGGIVSKNSGVSLDIVEKIGIASLLLYMQYNVVGPFQEEGEPVDLRGSGGGNDLDDAWVLQELGENGEDIVGKISFPEYLLLARISLDTLGKCDPENPRRNIWMWWKFRIACCTQYILSERSQVLLDRINEFVAVLEEAYAVDANAEVHERALNGILHIEASNIFVVFGMVSRVKYHISKASELLGIDASLTGALGIRTVHQKDAHAQLVVQAFLDDAMLSFRESHGTFDGTYLDELILNRHTSENGQYAKKIDIDGLETDSDVFRGGPLLAGDPSELECLLRKDLTGLHQLFILSLCNYVKKSSSPDGTQPWELAAYTEFILAQDRTEFLPRLTGYMEMARLEVQRSRTRERALVTFEGIKDAFVSKETEISKDHRMKYAFSIKIPCRAVLWKEIGEAFVACGLIGAALQLFESAELWDSLIVCYHLLQKNEVAENLVRKRLEVTPNDAKLLCALGDLIDSDEYYNKAWECSNHRSARAQRSLARFNMRRDDFEMASSNWEKALHLSPLHLEGWFSLGWCYMKIGDNRKAVNAFTRLVQMDPDDGRAWNNLAMVHMKLENWQEAFVAFGEASKHSRDLWQTWENYALVACQLQDFNTAGRAYEQVVTLTRGEGCNHNVLQALVESVDTTSIADTSEKKLITTKEEQLHSYVANILKKIAASSKGSGDPRFWKMYGRYYSRIGKPSLQVECLSKQVRALQTSDWHSQEEQFVNYAQACIDLGRSHISSPNSTKIELSQSRMLLRNALHRSKDAFEDHPIYNSMQIVLDEVAETLNGT